MWLSVTSTRLLSVTAEIKLSFQKSLTKAIIVLEVRGTLNFIRIDQIVKINFIYELCFMLTDRIFTIK